MMDAEWGAVRLTATSAFGILHWFSSFPPWKREKEITELAFRPHPYEFFLYYDC